MDNKKLNKKLSLKKEVLTRLNDESLDKIKGGKAQFTSIADCSHWTCTAGSTRSSNLCVCGG